MAHMSTSLTGHFTLMRQLHTSMSVMYSMHGTNAFCWHPFILHKNQPTDFNLSAPFGCHLSACSGPPLVVIFRSTRSPLWSSISDLCGLPRSSFLSVCAPLRPSLRDTNALLTPYRLPVSSPPRFVTNIKRKPGDLPPSLTIYPALLHA